MFTKNKVLKKIDNEVKYLNRNIEEFRELMNSSKEDESKEFYWSCLNKETLKLSEVMRIRRMVEES